LAIDYIKECALSDLSGDCRLIEKIYLDPEQKQFFFMDPKKSNVTYYNEQKEQIVEAKDTFGRKLANNLQNSYLKSINFLINRNLNARASPNKFLEDYDVQTWNTHIYNLSDTCYQRRMIGQLKIPTK
jgi:hypothetical protein